MDREKVIGHLNDCMEASRRDNTWVFVRKDIVVDALALLKEQQNQIWEMQDRTEYIEDKLNEQPQIVRCKDCKYSLSNSRFCAYPHKKNNIQPCDWYCADGERKENA